MLLSVVLAGYVQLRQHLQYLCLYALQGCRVSIQECQDLFDLVVDGINLSTTFCHG